MKSFLDLEYVKSYSTLPETLYTFVKPTGLSSPTLVCASQQATDIIGIDLESLQTDESLQLLSGNGILSNWQPLAMKYTGHQFGYYNPDLGDGRGLLIAEVLGRDNQQWDLHLKGAGLTPYSRQGDGRAVLRSSIREFLCSEAMAALNIPTTRALAVINSDTPVYREKPETGAMLMRLARTHIRFGHFEYCSFTGQHELLKTLADYVLDLHYPEHAEKEHSYLYLFEQSIERTASLLAKWQTVGFAHGVMNTDNMSILGDTFDYGPYAFMDDFEPDFICNHSDHEGRYAFNQQPNIANWNLAVLAQALLSVTPKVSLLEALERYPTQYKEHFIFNMCRKLGLEHGNSSNESFIDATLSMMAKNRLDFTHFFRSLSTIEDDSVKHSIRDHCVDLNAFDSWYERYQNLVANLDISTSTRKKEMDLVNPKYILRNYLAQEAIEAAQHGDYTKVKKLHQVLQKPFDEQPENEQYAALPPDWGKKLEISCSS